MTREERALKNLKQMCSDGRYLGSGSYIPLEVLEDFKVVIEVLEQEPKIGHWTDDGYCSCCNKQTLPLDISGYASGYDSFCPNCGAKMESEG